jgi:hypothetical protein
MADFLEQLLQAQIGWEATNESKYVFCTTFRGKIVRLRLNDFPDEPICTVIINNQEIDVEHVPDNWSLPSHREEGELER